ncbi:glycoside hydrolase family 31 protein [Enterococcus thailandicus]|uniref:glycoside hydrolase family 31 protein n=1 Tax=Enterococcus thailandicus TaxID=417368 RepID=UPI00372CFC87
MELEPKFAQILTHYTDVLNQSANLKAIADLSGEQEKLPIAAATVWVKMKAEVHLNDTDFGIVKRIQQDWAKEVTNVFGEESDNYTSNLAIYYITLSEVKNKYHQNDLQKEITEIRDYIFDHLIRRGTLISSVKQATPAVDLVLSVLPFGLFAPEDLIMVAGMEELVSRKTTWSKDEAALLGIYFTEKYDFVKAENYLMYAKEQTDKNEVFVDLLDTYLRQKKESLSTSPFIHKPLGNGNVYEKLPYERTPHYPTVGETCTFDVQVNSKNVTQIFLTIEGLAEKIVCTLINDTLRIYQAHVQIPETYSGGSYFFTAENHQVETSDRYELIIQKHWGFNKIEFIGSNKNENVYLTKNMEQSLFLKLQEDKLTLSQIEPQLDSVQLKDCFASINDKNTICLPNEKEKLPFYFSENCLTLHELAGKGAKGVTLRLQDQANLYYGFGERYNSINQLGNEIDCFVYNQYRDQGTRTYMPMPYYFTNDGYGLYFATDSYTRFDLKKNDPKEITIYVETSEEENLAEIHLLHGEMKEMIAQYMTCTGEPVMVPSWALGPWMSSNNWDRESVVRNELEQTTRYDIPATVIVLEQWSDETTYYMFNDAQYPLLPPEQSYSYDQLTFPAWGRWPDPKRLIEDCHKNGLKFILWQIPIEKYLNQQKHPLKDQDEAYMIEKGYVVKNADGSPYRIPENWFTDSLLLDFTNEEAKRWWFEKRQYLIDIGVDGFKTDGGEMVYGSDLVFADGRTGSQMRNRYPKEYIKAYYDFAQQNQGITFSRSGYTGAHAYPAHWAGDERSTFDAFKRQLIAGINSGMSGVIFWGWDLAGFNGDIPTAELFMRSSSMAAFCPIMQYHAESKGEYNQDRTPWNIAERTNTPEVIEVYRFFANTRMNLLPYIYDQAVKSVTNKVPLMRAMQIDYPLENFEDCYDQFMFGESLLIAPIVTESATSRQVTFPRGTWIDFWTKEKVAGGQTIIVHAEMNQIPVYVKENSVILLNLGESKRIGESIGNDLSNYTNATLLVTATTDFNQTITDHLGNTFDLQVSKINQKVTINKEMPMDIELICL